MTTRLGPGEGLANGAYRIERVLSSSSQGGVYEAVKIGTGEELILRELTPPTSLEDPAGALSAAVEQLQRAEHPGLVKVLGWLQEQGRFFVVCEQVEGASLATVLEWSPEPIGRSQVLRWALELQDLLAWLLESCRFVPAAGSLDAGHLLVDGEGRLRLPNRRLDALLDQQGGPLDESGLLEQHRRVMWQITEAMPQAPADLVGRLNHRCTSLKELEKNLRLALFEVGEKVEIVEPTEEFEVPEVSRPRVSGFWSVFFSRHPARVGLDLLVLLALLWAVPVLLLAPDLVRTEPRVYVACEERVLSLNESTITNRIGTDGRVRALASPPGDRTLFVALEGDPRLRQLDTSVERWDRPALELEEPPSDLLAVSPELLLAFYENIPGISCITVAEPAAVLTGTLAAGRDSRGTVVRNSVDGASLVACSPDTSDLYRYDLRNHAMTAGARCPQPTDVTALDAERVAVAQTALQRVTILDARTLEPESEITRLGGADPVGLLAVDSQLWCLNRSGSLSRLSLDDSPPLITIQLKGAPADMAEVGEEELWISLPKRGSLARVNRKTGEILSRVDVGGRPSDIVEIP